MCGIAFALSQLGVYSATQSFVAFEVSEAVAFGM